MTVLTLKEAITKGKLAFKPWLTKFSPEIFEVDFSEIIRGRGNVDYLDPAKFYALTYLTERMKDVLELCLVRTSGQNNKGTIHLATGFGGGKSHLLALLYHTFTSKVIIDNKMLRKLELSDVPDVMVVAADGHNLSFPLIKNKVLGKYLCKTKEETKHALEAEETPVLILLDEFVVYLAKLSEEKQKKELATFHTFMSAVNATKNCILVITNPEGAAVYGREVQMLKTTLDKSSIITAASGMAEIMGRVTQPIVPVEQSDFISILKVRVF